MSIPNISEASLPSNHWEGIAFTPFGKTLNHFGKGPKNYVRSDERIYEDVCELLTEHKELDASEIEVSVQDSEVTLKGSVTTRGDKRLAEDLAASARGVHDVHNRLKVVEGPASMLGSLARSGVTAII